MSAFTSLPADAPGPEDNAISLERETFPLIVEKLIYGGNGLARLPNGEVLFVPWSAPGDRAMASRLPGNQKPARAEIATLLHPSGDRVTPRCDVFGVCGGCQWQHLNGEAQREWKRRIVEESLRRLGGFKDIAVNPTWGSNEQSWRYRNRAQWELTVSDGAPRLGYSQAQSHEIVAFGDCHLIPDDLNAIHDDLTRLLQSGRFGEGSRLAQAIQRIEACRNPEGECLLSIYGDRHPALRELTAILMEERTAIKGVVHFEQRRKQGGDTLLLGGKGYLTHRLANRIYRVSAGSFFQTNTQAAEYMLRQAMDWLPENIDSLLDLYAGVGTFALALQEKTRQCLAVEQAGISVEDAAENVRLNRIDNVTLRVSDADKAFDGLETTFDAAVLNPPRGGASSNVLYRLSKHVANRILYISCNPTTLARDLKTLSGLGWRIENVQPIDMFPQTYHVETMVQLTR